MQPRKRPQLRIFPGFGREPRRPVSQGPARQPTGFRQRRPVPVPSAATQRTQQRRPALPAGNPLGFLTPRFPSDFSNKRNAPNFPLSRIGELVRRAAGRVAGRAAVRISKRARRELRARTDESVEKALQSKGYEDALKTVPGERVIAKISQADAAADKLLSEEFARFALKGKGKKLLNNANIAIKKQVVELVASGQIRSKEELSAVMAEIAKEMGIPLSQKNPKAHIEGMLKDMFNEEERKMMDKIFTKRAEIDLGSAEGREAAKKKRFEWELSRKAA